MAGVAALAVLVGGGYVGYRRFLGEDSGVALCEVIRDGGTIAGRPAGGGDLETD